MSDITLNPRICDDPATCDSGNFLPNSFWTGSFQAMASPCEILLDTQDQQLAIELTQLAQREALRIQHKFSRYEQGNSLWQINQAAGRNLSLDDETALLINFADHCYHLSDGMFDISSGCLRRAWTFNGSDQLPPQQAIDRLLPLVGWDKVSWQNPQLQMPAGMELDLGGIGKEYAVDRVLQLLCQRCDFPLLINFGGDLAVSGPRAQGQPWRVGIEAVTTSGNEQAASGKLLEISAGALATSGDSRRYLLHQGKRYSHILNPITGWPVEQAPRSVTVAAGSCLQAGMLATFALLQGAAAEQFLTEQGAIFWCLR